MFGMTADEYLSVLEKTTVTDNPFVSETYTDEERESFVDLAHSLAAFVRKFSKNNADGYDGAVQVCEALVHALPDPAQEAAIAAALDDILASMDDKG